MEDNKKPTFNVLFARGVVEQDYLEFLKMISSLTNFYDFTGYNSVTKENINEHLENLRKQIEEYDLNKLGLD